MTREGTRVPTSSLPSPPGPASNGYVNLSDYARDPLGFLTVVAREFRDIARFRLAGREYVLVNHSDYIQDVLVTRHRSFSKGRFYEELKRLLGEGLLTSEGDVHQRQRRLVQPLFHHERISAYGEVMVDYAERTAARWRPGAEARGERRDDAADARDRREDGPRRRRRGGGARGREDGRRRDDGLQPLPASLLASSGSFQSPPRVASSARERSSTGSSTR